jgi:DNA gyrase subunit A
MMDGPAAMRYTNIMLSKYGETFLMSDYLAVSDLVPNYDDNTTEPVVLPALLPNLLLNGTQGIGVGTTSSVPSYTLASVLGLLIRRLKKEKLEIKDYVDDLEFNFPWGGEAVKSKENRKAIAQFYKTGDGSIQFTANLKYKLDHGKIMWDDFPPGLNVEKAVDKLREIEGIKSVINYTDKTGVKFLITLQKISSDKYRDKVLASIRRIVTASSNFKINLTKRTKKDNDVEVELFSTTIPELIDMWLAWRVNLEARCLDYRITREKANIAYSKLLLYAIDNLDVIFKSLRQEDPNEYLVKHLKITIEQANVILDLKVRQLSKLDRRAIETKMADQKTLLAQLAKWREKPSSKVRMDFESMLKAVEKDDGKA